MTETPIVAPELRANLEAIRNETLQILIYLGNAGIVVWMISLLFQLQRSIADIGPSLVPLALFGIGLLLAWRLQARDRYVQARFWFFVATIGAPMFYLAVQPTVSVFLVYVLVLPTLASGLLVSSTTPFRVAAILSVLLLITISAKLDIAAGNLALAIRTAIGPIVLQWLIALISWLATRDLVLTVQWAMENSRLADRRAERLAESESRVARTLLELRGSYELQTRLNQQLHILNEQLIQARSIADDANTLKTRFLANMSHELRTPLNAIINFTQFMGKPRYGHLTEQQRELQARVLANSEHLLGLINDILDLSKIEAGRMQLLLEPLDLQPIVRGVMATAVGLTRSKGLQLELDLPDSLPHVRGDKLRVRQILLNLLSNAAKFTDAGTLTLRVVVQPALVQIAVIDTGNGIPPDELPLVFKEFHQVERAASARSQQGTGLGLPISRHLVELQGGTMWAESMVGHGSTFAFTLPIATSDAAETVIFDPTRATP